LQIRKNNQGNQKNNQSGKELVMEQLAVDF